MGGGSDKWYRLWKSGWLEQGGKVKKVTRAGTQVDFLKSFRDTTYIIMGTCFHTTVQNELGLTGNPISTTACKFYLGAYNGQSLNFDAYWKVEGWSA